MKGQTNFEYQLRKIERRRWQLWFLAFLLIILFALAVVFLSYWGQALPEAFSQFADYNIIRLSLLLLSVAFCAYVAEREVIFRRLDRRLLKEQVKSQWLKQKVENEKKTITKLKELDKMKADFVASVSHELRSPLTTIKGYLDLLAEGDAGPVTEQQVGFINIIDQSSGRLLNLINDLLTVSKIESATLKMNKRMISLNSILEKVCRVMNPEARQKGLDLRVRTAKRIPSIEADSERVEQVIINLISNAIKFTPKGGTVEIRSETKDGALVVSVKDTGMGISTSDKRQIFDKFFRSQDAISKHIKGTGLGLSIAKGIIEQHQGKIWLESKPGKGSTFYFSLPIKKKKAA